jgi:PDZ domain-containing protein
VARRRWRWAVLAVVLVLGGVAAGLWLAPSNQYLLLPDKAQPVAPLVKVEDEQLRPPGDEAGIYMVDILVRRATLLEEIFPAINGDATLVPERAFNPVGVDDAQRDRSQRIVMADSQQVAAAVALRSLGYDVEVVFAGAQISLIVPDSPADAVDLEPGDVIVRANGRDVESPEELRGALAGVEPGSSISLSVRRGDGFETLSVGTKTDDENESRAVIGVLVDQAATIDLPVDVSIDTGNIGGPSAGLAFALDIVDELGTDVDRGRRIVVTGELGLDGTVGSIGGIKQKVIGAREADADIFVVPDGNAEEARKYADGIEILPVGTFAEALDDLGVESVS